MRKLVGDRQTRLRTLSSDTSMPQVGLFKGRNGRGAEETEDGEEEEEEDRASLLQRVGSFPSHLLLPAFPRRLPPLGTPVSPLRRSGVLGVDFFTLSKSLLQQAVRRETEKRPVFLLRWHS